MNVDLWAQTTGADMSDSTNSAPARYWQQHFGCGSQQIRWWLLNLRI